jgi:putative DNA primase/helicase
LNASDRDTWVRAAFAVKHELGPDGFDLWDNWSQSGAGYDAKSARDVWKSAHAAPRKGGSPVTIGSIISEAQHFGFKLDAERTPVSQEEIARRERERTEREAAAKAEAERRLAEAKAKAAALWDAAQEIDGDEHPYLARKGVLSFGLRVGTYRKGIRNCLLVPLRQIDGTLVSVQAYFEQASPMFEGRDRDYLPGGQKWGAFHLIGGPGQVIVVCEGYSTGASIHQATGYSVAVALDAGNVPTVAQALRNAYPLAQIIIAADDDCWHDDASKPNDGMLKARQACSAAGALLAQPRFRDTTSKPTDFNDLHQLEGIDAVRAQIEAALPKPAANDNTPRISMESGCNVFEFPHQKSPGKLLNTAENLAHMLDEYGVSVRYNLTKREVEIRVPGRTYTDDNRDNAALAELTSLAARNGLPVGSIPEYVKLIADRNAYDPVRDWITSKPWDGVSRLRDLYETVSVEGQTAMRDLLIYRWLLSAVAAVFVPRGFESHGVLVFTGEQGQGKTKWIKRLVPDGLDAVLAGKLMDPNNKDHVITATSHWLVELGELDATFRKADIAALKSFITNSADKLRRPYDRVDSNYRRRTVFFASVNDRKYLVDDTGNRRWWTVPTVAVNYEHDIDVQQLWAEVLVLFQSGERHWLDRAEQALLQDVNVEHEMPNPIEELIQTKFNWDAPRSTNMTASQVLLAIGFDKPNAKQAKDAGVALRRITGGEPKKSNGRLVFVMPPPARSTAGDDDARPF